MAGFFCWVTPQPRAQSEKREAIFGKIARQNKRLEHDREQRRAIMLQARHPQGSKRQNEKAGLSPGLSHVLPFVRPFFRRQ